VREAQSAMLERSVEERTAGQPEPLSMNASEATRKSSRPHQRGPLQETLKDISILLSYLIQLPHHELWSGGRPLLTASTNEIRLAILPSLSAGNATTSSHMRSPHGIVDPVLVHFAAAGRDGRLVARRRLFGKLGRSRVRARSVAEALALLQMLAKGARSKSAKS